MSEESIAFTGGGEEWRRRAAETTLECFYGVNPHSTTFHNNEPLFFNWGFCPPKNKKEYSFTFHLKNKKENSY